MASQSLAEPFHIEHLEGGVVAGPWRRPPNTAAGSKGSIHDDATAQKLGLRGGTIAGSFHMEQFVPLLCELFGRRWLETGSLSLYFEYATRDEEAVRCFARLPEGDATRGDVRNEVWMDHESGRRVAAGTASGGAPDADSAVRRRIAAVPPARDLRIYDDVVTGTTGDGVDVRIESRMHDRHLPFITEQLPEHTDPAIRGGRVAALSQALHTMGRVTQVLVPRGRNRGVQLFGGIEIQHYAGPVLVDHDYRLRGSIKAVGETPKTEYFWYESILYDPATGRDVAGMHLMLRTMKASHPAWQ
jgi:hypothetical protein